MLEQLRCDAQGDRRALHRLAEEAVRVVSEEPLEAVGYPARGAAHAGGEVDEQGVVGVDRDSHAVELGLQAAGGDGVAAEQVDRALVVDEVARRVGVGGSPALTHGARVVVGVLDNLDALFAQQVLLPLLGVGRHVHDRAEPERGARDADRQAQVPGRADLDGVASEELPRGGSGERGVVVADADEAGFQGEVLGMLEHLVDAAARLHGASYGQMAVHLEEEASGQGRPTRPREGVAHRGNLAQGRLDEAAGRAGLGKRALEEGGEALEARGGVGDGRVGDDEVAQGAHRVERQEPRVGPAQLACLGELLDGGVRHGASFLGAGWF